MAIRKVNKFMIKRILSGMLAAGIVSTMAVGMTGCGDSSDPGNKDGDVNFGGKTLTIASWVDFEPELGKSESEDAAYYALQQAMEKFNVKVQWNITTQENHFSQFQAKSLSGLVYADIVLSHSWNHVSLISQGLQTPLDEYYDAMSEEEKSHWDMELSKFGDHYYGLSPKSNVTLPIACMFYNRTRLKELKLQDPQELARQGKWTWDKFHEYCKAATDAASEKYGLSMYNMYNVLGGGNNVKTVVFDETDGKYYNGFTHGDEAAKNMQCLEFLTNMSKDKIVYGDWIQGSEAMDDAENAFLDGQTLFTFAQNGARLKKLGMTDFGVVTTPIADFNTDQSLYNLMESFTYWMIPSKTNFPAADIFEFWAYAQNTWDKDRGDAYYEFNLDNYKEEQLDLNYTDMKDVEFLVEMSEKVVVKPSLDLSCSLGDLVANGIYCEVISGNATPAAAVAAKDNEIQAKIDEALNSAAKDEGSSGS